MTSNNREFDKNDIKSKTAVEKYNHEKKVWGNTSIGFSIATTAMIYKACSLLNNGEIGFGLYVGLVGFACGYTAYNTGKRFYYTQLNREKCINDLIIKNKIQYYKN